MKKNKVYSMIKNMVTKTTVFWVKPFRLVNMKFVMSLAMSESFSARSPSSMLRLLT